MDERDQELLQACTAFLDGSDPGWDRLAARHPEWEKEIGSLRVVASVSARFRRLGALAPPAQPAATTAAATQAATAADDLPFHTWGHLQLVEKIGAGAFGEVFRAFDPTLRTEVALKLLREGHRFVEEAQKLAQVRHKNIVVVHGAAEHRGRAGLWTDFLRGRTLEALIAEQGPFSPREAAGIGIEISQALAAVHRAGLLHRDVKASNVMRTEGGRFVLMDFGAAAVVDPQGQLAAGERNFGTPLAMAPEQLDGKAAGPATDVYGLGVLLYRLVSGRYPVEAASLVELRDKLARRDCVALRDVCPEVPSDFVRVVERAIDPDPRARFRTAGELERALEATLGVAPARRASRGEWVRGLWAGVRRRPWVWVPTGTAAVAAAVLVGWWLLSPRHGSQPRTEGSLPATWMTPRGGPGVPAAPDRSMRPLTASARLHRKTAHGDEVLPPGATIGPEDRLWLEFRCSENVFVYIVNEDEMGKRWVLFPLRVLEQGNPVPGGETVRLPGVFRETQRPKYWSMSSQGGREKILVAVSRTRQKELEDVLATMPQAGSQAAVEVDEKLDVALRGLGSLAEEPGPRPASAETGLTALYHRLTARASKDLWAQLLELNNP